VPDDWERVARLRQAAFNWPGEPALLDGMWVVEDAREILACARLELDGQWLGGRAVPTGLLSSVAVGPAARGRGFGTNLLRGLLRHARESGLPRLALYPSAVRPYRRAGFEISGVAVTQSVDAARLPRSRHPGVDEMRADDQVAVMASYDRLAAGRTGAIARSGQWWTTRVFAATPPTPRSPADLLGFVVRDGSRIVGYVLYTQAPAGGGSYATRISCRDLAWETDDAGRALFGLLGSGHPMTTTVDWMGEAVDPAGFLLDDPPVVMSVEPWMARLVDPMAALREHATAPDARANLSIAVVDPIEPDWSIGLHLGVRDGRVDVEAERPDAPIDATIESGALAALLAGALRPEVASATGRLVPGSAGLAPFSALLPPGRPWIGDRF
jgi:predicted acetyltransferase